MDNHDKNKSHQYLVLTHSFIVSNKKRRNKKKNTNKKRHEKKEKERKDQRLT
jgi:hypothetical protein